MKTIADLFEDAFKKMKERKWDCIYVAVDIHGTVIIPNYDKEAIPTEFYPYAKHGLRILSQLKCVKLVLYTCSYPHEIEEYLELFKSNGIFFDYVNENPEVVSDNNLYGCYDKKFYRNITLDDTGGFEPINDWCFFCYTAHKMYKNVYKENPEIDENNVTSLDEGQ